MRCGRWTKNAALLARMRERFRYILVDEFQDTNVAQLELLWRLAGEHGNIVAVGDDAQAIYRFRGASFGSFTIFLEKFAGVAQGDPAAAARFVRPLADNYRSTARDAARGRAGDQLPGTFAAGAEEGAGAAQDIRAKRCASSSWVRRRRRRAGSRRRLHGCTPRGCAGAASRRCIGSTRTATRWWWRSGERGIPFVIRNLSILNHRLVLDVLAYLRLIARPSDDLACARVLAAPAWGLAGVGPGAIDRARGEGAEIVVGDAAGGAGRAAVWRGRARGGTDAA